ncbi:RES domain-containing protein [Salinisphaera sp.]|uniref:RES domain-containing protein n=1 Tax=Salinisphaera sp. TaxID=1914330 RepID=UPI002D77980F|nr:RES domain-containing protein [Salinisphaera sp.]HET7315313.1 RES domain-containing protein [Salinisphaera sp.]
MVGRIERAFPLDRLAALKPFTDVIRDFKLPQEVVELGRRIGLGAPQTVGSPKVLMRTLLAPDWRYLPSNHGLPANPQVFGALLRDAEFEGIVYRSARGHDHCLAVFPEMLDHSDTQIALHDAAPASATRTILDASTWKELV